MDDRRAGQPALREPAGGRPPPTSLVGAAECTFAACGRSSRRRSRSTSAARAAAHPVLDVREADEFTDALGHIHGAALLPLPELRNAPPSSTARAPWWPCAARAPAPRRPRCCWARRLRAGGEPRRAACCAGAPKDCRWRVGWSEWGPHAPPVAAPRGALCSGPAEPAPRKRLGPAAGAVFAVPCRLTSGGRPAHVFCGKMRRMNARHPAVAPQLDRLIEQIGTIIVGKRSQIEDCVACLLAGGHLLIEDVPGVGKTTLAHALAVSLGPALLARAVHGRPDAERPRRRVRVRAHKEASSSIRARCSRRCCSPTRSTGPGPRRRARCSRPWRSSRCRWRTRRARCRGRSS
jgi:hypothetical protein